MAQRKEKEGQKIKTSLILPEDLWIRLKVAAAQERTEMSTIIAGLVERYVQERERRKRGKER